MKQFDELNYYELFEIPPAARLAEIKKAYEIAKKTYSGDSLATYSLFDDEIRQKILDRIEEAFSVLSDDKRRQQYDIQIGVIDPKFHSRQPTQQTIGRSATASEKPAVAQTVPERLDPSTAVRHSNDMDITGREINGRLFQELRERQGIPLQEVADKTRINITYLQYIEKERFDGLPEEVYLKSYLMQYTKMLGLDPVPITDHYLMRYEEWRKSKK
jgi:curved DNA-binding protein CbpA